MAPGGIYKSTDAAFTGWQDVTPSDGYFSTWPSSRSPAQTRSTPPGITPRMAALTWQPLRPGDIRATVQIIFDPDDPQIGYLGDDIYGVQKTTDGGQTWTIKSQGLAA